MHILMICASAPTRERPRASGFIAALARNGHTVTLVFVDKAGTVFDNLTDCCERIVPVRGRRRLAKAVAAEIEAAAFDLVHIDGPAARLVAGPLALPTVLDAASCGVMRRERAVRAGGLLGRIAHSVQVVQARRCHAVARASKARLLVATPADAWSLRTLGADAASLHVVPSAVDLARFTPPTTLREQATVALDVRGLERAEVMAALDYAKATMRQVWAQRAEARLTVIGHVPFGGVSGLAGDSRVTFAGATSDPRGHLARATLVLAPVVPSGAPTHAPLEAMATGAPVVGVTALAAELEAAPGHELVVAAEASGWAASILGLLDDPPYRGKVGRAGRRLVERRHDPQLVITALEQVYAAAVGVPLAEWRLAVGLGTAYITEP